MKLFNRMRNTGIALLGGVALLSFSAVATGCSDNDEQGLYAADGANIDLKVDALGLHNGQIDLGSAQSETVFTVTSTTRWTVDVSDCEGAWCQVSFADGNSDAAGQIGDGTFIVDAAPNRSGDSRECNVTVYAIDSEGTHIPGKSFLVHVVQDRQSIQVDYSGGEISYQGTGTGSLPRIIVKANQEWEASSSHSWVKIVPGPDMDGDKYKPVSDEERSVYFNISVEANPGTSVRYAEVSISSPSNAFIPIRVNITQSASTETFFVTPTEVPQAAWSGETLEFSVYSPRESWTVQAISAGDWVELDKTSGEASDAPVTIRATVAANNTSVPRQASVVFTRANNMGTTVVYITQNASAEAPNPDDAPQVSQPWVNSGWTATYAHIYAYFTSPTIAIERVGVAYENVDDPSDYHDVRGTIGNGNLISVELTDLKPNTTYRVWAFVEYQQDGGWHGSSGDTMTFTTPGLNGEPGTGLPGEDDNTPPSPNN